MNPPERPASVPAHARWEANWDSNEYLWITGEVVNGIRQGPYRYYRIDGTLCSEDVYTDGVLNGPAKRFHENGEVSQQGQMRDGLRDGLWQWIRSTGPTTEHTLPLDCNEVVWSGTKLFDYGKAGPAMYYDINKTPVNPDGTPIAGRPDNVPPEAAYYKPEDIWYFGFTAKEHTPHHRVGKWIWWNNKGIILKETIYDDGGKEIEDNRYYDNGQLSLHRKKDSFGNLVNKINYNRDGTLRQELRFFFEQRDLICSEKFGEQGVLLWRGNKSDNELTTYTFYHENGIVSAEGQETDGYISGTWCFYDQHGQLKNKVDVSLLGVDYMEVDEYFDPGWLLGKSLMPDVSTPLPPNLSAADRIDWTNIIAAYSNNVKNFPRYIRGLVSPEPTVRMVALEQIREAVEHQGTLYSATTLVTPLLIGALNNKNADKASILQLLNIIASAVSIYSSQKSKIPAANNDIRFINDDVMTQVAQHLAEGSTVFLQMLTHDDPQIQSASLLLLRFAPPTKELKAKLSDFILNENEKIQATAVFVLLSIQHSDPQEAEPVLKHPNRLVQLVAAISAGIRFGPLAPAQTINILKETLEAADKALREKFHSLPFVEEDMRASLSLAIGRIGNASAKKLLPLLCERINDVDSINSHLYAHGLLTLAIGDGSARDANALTIALNAIANSAKFFEYVNWTDVMLQWRLPTQRDDLMEFIGTLERDPDTYYDSLLA